MTTSSFASMFASFRPLCVAWLMGRPGATCPCERDRRDRVNALSSFLLSLFLADAMSAQFSRNPLALAAALEKIEHAEEPTRSIKQGSAHLCIADPLGRKSSLREGKLADIFGTHPPMAIRVARLKAMGYQEKKKSQAATGD